MPANDLIDKAGRIYGQGIFKHVFEKGPIPMALISGDMRFKAVNEAFCRLVEYPRSSLLAMGPMDLTPREDLGKCRAFFDQLRNDELARFFAEQRFVTRSSTPVWVNCTGFGIRDESQDIAFMLEIVEDTTERKRTERRLAAQYAIARALAESPSLEEVAERLLEAICRSLEWEIGGFWTVDAESGNLRCLEFWSAEGTSVEEFEKATRSSVFHPGVGLPGRVWSRGKPAWIEDVVKDKNFPRAPAALRCGVHGAFGFPIVFEGRIVGVLEFFSRAIRRPDEELLASLAASGDQIGQFIERRRAEAELRRRTLELARSNAELESFAMVAAHDLQEPLRKIVSYGDYLEQKAAPLSPETATCVDQIRRAALRMSDHLESLVKYSRVSMSAGRGEPVALADIMNTIVDEFAWHIREARGQVRVGALPIVMGDREQLRHLFENLVMNALKFHPPDRPPVVEIGARRTPGWVHIDVKDNGIGFEQRFSEAIFRPFQRLHKPNEFPGSGMGLAIALKIAVSHEGSISAVGEPGKGSIFTVSLPAEEK